MSSLVQDLTGEMIDSETVDWPGRWEHISKVVERPGPFNQPEYGPGETVTYLRQARVLVIGAGGLGCELLKNLALMGFANIDVIDMDVIELSNLNRQFLFRTKDIGRSKAEVAAEFINSRVPGCHVTPHCKKIQDFDCDFYMQFNFIICGLDSVVARRWINGMVMSLLDYVDGNLDTSTIKPLIDGGTEGFKGNARVIIPTQTACIECTLDLFPPQVNYPLCTIANIPRLPEHCIEYVRTLQWGKEQPFDASSIDGDDPAHIQWIYEKSLERAQKFNIEGVSYRLTQGVIKRIIPAVASTNAVVAAACVNEVFKLATSSAAMMDNYMVFNDVDGVYTYTYQAERKDNCPVCNNEPQTLEFAWSATLQEVYDHLVNNLQMKAPGMTTTNKQGNPRTLYMQSFASLEEATRPNLKKTLKELDMENGQQVLVADETAPQTLIFILKLTDAVM